MTTFYPYTVPVNGPFVFQPTLDGQQYVVSVFWLVAGQRPYLTVTQLNTTPVVTLPLIGSAVAQNIQSITWADGEVTVNTQQPHGYDIGETLDLTVSGVNVAAYNGVQRCFVTAPNVLVYDLATNPGPASIAGVIGYDVNILKGYFNSSLVYRPANMNFEVSP